MTSGVSSGDRHAPGRPLVVLAGWLGCRPRSLRRYEDLYRRMGFEVLSVIPPPASVVAAASTPIDEEERGGGVDRSMVSLAAEALRAADSVRCSALAFHAFSNGGAFLWERARMLLFESPAPCGGGGGGADGRGAADADAPSGSLDVGTRDRLRSKLVGVVFDSSPAYYADDDRERLGEAMRHCSPRDRIAHALASVGTELLGESRRRREAAGQRRALEYWMGMRDDPVDVPHLYIYSEDDALAPTGRLRELVDHRRERFGPGRVFSRKFRSSPHCSHLLRHPKKYCTALENFVEFCCRGGGRAQPARL